MEPQKEIDFYQLIREFDRNRIRYLIIGRRAVILYGGPVLTGDYDLWVHPADRKKALTLLSDELDFELSHGPDTRRPIVTGFSGMKKYDLFFHRRISTIEDDEIDFDQCYGRATVLEDKEADIRFRVPSVDDLIRLKKIRAANPKDAQDIEYLLKAKRLLKKAAGRRNT